VVSSTPWPHFTPGKDLVPILHEAGWALGLVWTGTVHTSKVKVKVQFTLEYTMKAQRGSRGIAIFFL